MYREGTVNIRGMYREGIVNIRGMYREGIVNIRGMCRKGPCCTEYGPFLFTAFSPLHHTEL